MKKPWFITLEGGEGAGKSTQGKLLHQAFQQAGIPTLYTREPGGTEGAEQIRSLLVQGNTSWDAMTELLLHFAARREHVEKSIKPALAAGKIVLCDRFSDSTLAYQGYAAGLGTEMVHMVKCLTIGDFHPDLTFFLDMPQEVGIERIHTRGGQEDRYERMGREFHSRVHAAFQQISKHYNKRFIKINADQPVKDVHQQLLHTLQEHTAIKLTPLEIY